MLTLLLCPSCNLSAVVPRAPEAVETREVSESAESRKAGRVWGCRRGCVAGWVSERGRCVASSSPVQLPWPSTRASCMHPLKRSSSCLFRRRLASHGARQAHSPHTSTRTRYRRQARSTIAPMHPLAPPFALSPPRDLIAAGKLHGDFQRAQARAKGAVCVLFECHSSHRSHS
ncbi:hypothetical protein BJY59DRAFT_32234 [Rhodotorula toruloides]